MSRQTKPYFPGKCNDFGDVPECLGTINPKYDMDFTDVEPGAIIHWCDFCGPRMHAIFEALHRKAMEQGQEFIDNFRDAIITVEKLPDDQVKH